MQQARAVTGRSLNILKFPQDIEAVPHKMLINIRSRSRAGAGTLTTTVGSSVRGAIALPVPEAIVETYNANYENVDLGVIGNAIADATSNLNLSGGFDTALGSLGTAAGVGIRRLAGLDNEQGMEALTTGALNVAGAAGYSVAINLTNRVAGFLGMNANASAALATGTGLIFNPHQAAVFKGVNLRRVTYTWSLAPKTEQESRSIESIVSTLRYAMLPSLARNKLFLQFPDEIEYKILGSQPGFDMPTTPCVITDIAFNRAPKGPSFFAKTGAPVLYALKIDLLEIKSLLKSDFEDRKGAYQEQTANRAPTAQPNPTGVAAQTNIVPASAAQGLSGPP